MALFASLDCILFYIFLICTLFNGISYFCIQKLCDTWIQIHRCYYDDDVFDFSHWHNDDDSIVYFIPMIEDENELNIFLISLYPPPLIGPYDYCTTPDEEYDLMIDKLRNQILKASPHARI